MLRLLFLIVSIILFFIIFLFSVVIVASISEPEILSKISSTSLKEILNTYFRLLTEGLEIYDSEKAIVTYPSIFFIAGFISSFLIYLLGSAIKNFSSNYLLLCCLFSSLPISIFSVLRITVSSSSINNDYLYYSLPLLAMLLFVASLLGFYTSRLFKSI